MLGAAAVPQPAARGCGRPGSGAAATGRDAAAAPEFGRLFDRRRGLRSSHGRAGRLQGPKWL